MPEIEPTMYGIRGHRVRTPEEAEEERQLGEATPPMSREHIARLFGVPEEILWPCAGPLDARRLRR